MVPGLDEVFRRHAADGLVVALDDGVGTGGDIAEDIHDRHILQAEGLQHPGAGNPGDHPVAFPLLEAVRIGRPKVAGRVEDRPVVPLVDILADPLQYASSGGQGGFDKDGDAFHGSRPDFLMK